MNFVPPGWTATVLRIEDGKALVDITELGAIWLHEGLWRVLDEPLRLNPPVRAWVPLEALEPA